MVWLVRAATDRNPPSLGGGGCQFLIMKGAKGSSFMDPGFIKWIDANTWPILAVTFCVLTVIFHVCIRAFKVNLFKLIILAGTFALAFAFAGNDLVNFVGVPPAAVRA